MIIAQRLAKSLEFIKRFLLQPKDVKYPKLQKPIFNYNPKDISPGENFTRPDQGKIIGNDGIDGAYYPTDYY